MPVPADSERMVGNSEVELAGLVIVKRRRMGPLTPLTPATRRQRHRAPDPVDPPRDCYSFFSPLPVSPFGGPSICSGSLPGMERLCASLVICRRIEVMPAMIRP